MSREQQFVQLVEDCRKLVNALLPIPDSKGRVLKLPHKRPIAKAFAKLLKKYPILREIYLSLIIHAIERRIVTYGELAEEINRKFGEKIVPSKGSWLGRSLGEILGVISLYEWAMGRPLLSVLVVRKDTRVPGEGFNRLLRAFGLRVNIRCEQERSFITWGYFFWQKAR
jgi:hypothetical protein